MRWSIRLGRFLGIDVYLHVTFLLLLAFVAVGGVLAERSVASALAGVGFFVAVFGCVLLHEFGHALAARRFGIATLDITLFPIGGLARLERIPERPVQELWVALAGPAVNGVILIGLAVLLSLFPGLAGGRGWSVTGGSIAERLVLVNGMLMFFNLIPAFPMDGGRVLRALLALRMDYARATRIAATLGQGIALIFAFLGLMGLLGGGGNPFLLFIALFVWIGASQESESVQMRSTLGGSRVRDAMLTDFTRLAPGDALSHAVALVMAGSQQDFPVMEGRQIVGVLTRQRLLVGLSERGRLGTVGESMDRTFPMAEAEEDLEEAIRTRSGPGRGPVPVFEGGELVGLLTWDNVTDFLLIRAALRGSGRDGQRGGR